MNILIMTGHPAQIHNFRLVKSILEEIGHRVFWMSTEKDISRYLLDYYKINYFSLVRPGKNLLSKLCYLLLNNYLCLRLIKKNKIDIVVSRAYPYAVLACAILDCPHIALSDTESSGIYGRMFTRFVTSFLTAKSYSRNLRKDQIRFDGNIELFYLHPNRFEPDAGIFDLLKIQNGEPYVIMRFVSWDAYHDKGLSGFTNANKIRAVKEFSRHASVFISAEKELPSELEPYRIKIPPERMHDALAHAKLFFGESATMASESAVLGTPGIYLDKVGRGYTDEEERYGLVFNYGNSIADQENAIAKGVDLLRNAGIKKVMSKNRERFLNDKIDMTAFMVWFIENYPQSFRIMKENPEYQYRFK
jgi:uncharacterized protein